MERATPFNAQAPAAVAVQGLLCAVEEGRNASSPGASGDPAEAAMHPNRR